MAGPPSSRATEHPRYPGVRQVMHVTAGRAATDEAAVTCGFAPGTSSADEAGMRASHVATALAAFLAGSTAATVLHRRAARPTPAATALPAAPAEEHGAGVPPFPPPRGEQPADRKVVRE